VRVRVQALDEGGVGVAQTFLTVQSNLEFYAPDANPSEPGYQIRLQDGEGELVLAPQGSPVTARLKFQIGLTTAARTFEVKPGQGAVAVGMLSATLGFPQGFSVSRDNLSVQARGYLENNVAGGKLYAAADLDGLPGTQDPLIRYPLSGDASTESVPLQGQDPLALEYDHPSFRAAYKLGSVPIDVLPVGERLTAASVVTRSNPVVSGFAAYVNQDRETETITPDGTRIVRLRLGNIVPDSETLQLQLRGAGQGLQGEATLQRNIDYTIDPDTGVVVLTQSLDRLASGLYPQGAALSDLVIRATYRLQNGAVDRRLAYGVQAKYLGTLPHGSYSLGAGVVSLDGVLTSGVRAVLDTPELRADLRGAAAGGVQLQADVQAASADSRYGGSLQARYQSAGYQGLQPISAGLSLTGSATAKLTPRLALIAGGDYHSQPAAQDGDAGAAGGSVSARADYQLAPFSVGAGLKYGFGDQQGLGAVLAAGYHQGKMDLDVVHTQPLGRSLGGELAASTEITARYAVTPTLRFGVHGGYNWATRSQNTALTLAQTLGNTSYEINYDLPTASGQGNRARLGVSTTLPLSQKLSLGLHAAASRNFVTASNDVSAGADLRYQGAGYVATLGSDAAYSGGKFSVALRAGVTGSVSDHLTLSGDALAQLGEAQGLRASFGYAYRSGALSSLGYLRYQNGSLAGNHPEVSFGSTAEYRQPRYAVRAGIEGRALLSDLDSLTYQPYVGGTVYVTDDIGIGGWGRALIQPASSTVQYGYGLEASLRALPGTWISAGYNFQGFEGSSGASYTRPGAYLRLDLTLDEAQFGGNSNR
jgi:hypothetical protein